MGSDQRIAPGASGTGADLAGRDQKIFIKRLIAISPEDAAI